MRRMLLLGLLVLLSMPLVRAHGIEEGRYARLARGVNLPFWFWYAPEDVAGRFDDAEFAALRDMGLTFVRVPIDLSFVLDAQADDLLNHDNLALLDDGIARLHAANLAVVVDIHSTSLADSDAANYSAALEDPAFVDVFVAFWEQFAAHLAARHDADMTVFGLMNEPVFYDDPSAWPPIQARLADAVRAQAPDHTLIVTAAQWSSIDTLVELPPLADDNVVYDFHFYEPFVFTHQGATWSSDEVVNLRGVPYPSSPAALAPVVNASTSEADAATLRWYGEEGWTRDTLAARIGLAADWAATHNVRVVCLEFGVYGEYAPHDDRVQWVGDVRGLLEASGIGWAMWEYDDSFGLARRDDDGTVRYDADVVAALGLQLP